MVLSSLEQAGYQIKFTEQCLSSDLNVHDSRRNHDWNANNSKRGIRMKISQFRENVSIEIQARTKIGSYLKFAECYASTRGHNNQYCSSINPTDRMRQLFPNYAQYSNSAEKLIEFLTIIEGEKDVDNWKKIEDLPPPLKFAPAYEEDISKSSAISRTVNNLSSVVKMNHFFEDVVVDSIVTMDDRLRLHRDGIEAPGANVWFVIKGTVIDNNGGKVSHAILVDPSITGFYALSETNSFSKKNGDFRVTPNMKPNNAIVDFHKVSEIDKKLISMSVELFTRTI